MGGIRRRKGTKFIKKIEKSDEMISLKGFEGGIMEIGQTYVRFLDIKKAGQKLDEGGDSWVE